MIAVLDPACGSTIAEIPVHDEASVDELVARARAAQPAWAATPVADRCAVLRRLRTWLLDHADEIIATVVGETGKTWEDGLFGEVAYTSQAAGFWARRAPGWLADRRVRASSPAVLGRRSIIRYAPHGVVGVISPWNNPLAIALGDCMPALVAGNAVVLKPSEETPLGGLLAQRALRECGLPDDVLQVATGPGATGAAVVDAVDMVMFTGSTRTGRAIGARCGERLIPCSLELGGKDPMIVLADADLDRAANAAVYYAMFNAGQTCISVERVYVEAAVHDAFVDRVVARVLALRQGDGRGGPGTVDVGSLTFPPQREIVDEHVRDAVALGARVLTGGRSVPGGGLFYEPTVLVDVDHGMRCMREETFGPTLPIMRVADADEAVALANDSAYGLGASVFTRDAARGEQIARRLEAGSVAVNDALVYFAAMALPMGGWKGSGVGVRHGEAGLHKFCRTQSLVVAGRLPKRDPHMFPNRARRSRLLLRALRLMAPRS